MDSEERPAGEERFDRYSARETDDGDLLVYDDENDDAWVRSDLTTEPVR